MTAMIDQTRAGAGDLHLLVLRLRAARPAPGRDCREDIEAAIRAVDQAMGEAANA